MPSTHASSQIPSSIDDSIWRTITSVSCAAWAMAVCIEVPAGAVPGARLLTVRSTPPPHDEVNSLGGDGIVMPTVRNEQQAFVGTFWAYGGTPSLCAPTR